MCVNPTLFKYFLSQVRHCITCLTDTVLMNELSENLLSRIFNPGSDLIRFIISIY